MRGIVWHGGDFMAYNLEMLMQPWEVAYLKTKPPCAVCGKTLTPRSVYISYIEDLVLRDGRYRTEDGRLATDPSNLRGVHVGCHNRTCASCGKRVAPKDRCRSHHHTWHQRCWFNAMNESHIKDGRPVETWEEWVAWYKTRHDREYAISLLI